VLLQACPAGKQHVSDTHESPAAHAGVSLQASPSAETHTSLTKLSEQQSPSTVPAASPPPGMQAHVPPTQLCEMQNASLVQADPCGRGTGHLPSMHEPEQQSESVLQLPCPGARQHLAEEPQKESLHSSSLPHGEPREEEHAAIISAAAPIQTEMEDGWEVRMGPQVGQSSEQVVVPSALQVQPYWVTPSGQVPIGHHVSIGQ
jgi:hypothetical protein